MGALRLARYLWAGLYSLVGLLFLPFFKRARVTRGVVLGEGAEWPGKLGWRYSAITLGHVVLSTREQISQETFEHELVHVRQYERWGPLFIPAYLVASLVALIKRRHYYKDNFFEAQARARSGA
jgi:hypothetical protein